MGVIHLTDENFEAIIGGGKGVAFVDFFAEWCGPCKMMSPIVEEIAEELGDSAKVCNLDVGESQAAAQKFGVMSIPTFIVFKDGEPVETFVGAQPKDAVLEKIKAHL